MTVVDVAVDTRVQLGQRGGRDFRPTQRKEEEVHAVAIKQLCDGRRIRTAVGTSAQLNDRRSRDTRPTL